MKNAVAMLSALCAMVALIFSSDKVIACARQALSLCTELILPSLFPFFVISMLLSRLGLPRALGKLLSPLARRLPFLSGAGASAFLIGISGGYPLGAAYIAELYRGGSLSRKEAEGLLLFCNNSGPAFIIGAVGSGLFSSVSKGLMLYGIHIAAALITALLFHRGEKNPPLEIKKSPEPFAVAFTGAVTQAVSSVLAVCGFVVCFTVLVGMLDAGGLLSAADARLAALFGAKPGMFKAIFTGFMELGSGVGAMESIKALPAAPVIAAGMLSWGGISVHFQTMAVLGDTDIDGRQHFLGRISCALIASLLAALAFL